jgi:hypothetical protein
MGDTAGSVGRSSRGPPDRRGPRGSYPCVAPGVARGPARGRDSPRPRGSPCRGSLCPHGDLRREPARPVAANTSRRFAS